MKIIYAPGCFDLYHFGHLQILKKAKELGDYLIVAVSSDKLMKEKGKDCIIPFKERVAIIEELKCVDRVVEETKIFDIEQFMGLKADIFVIGSDWKNRTDVPRLNWLKEHNKIVFLPYTEGISTTKIKEKIIQKYIINI